MPELILDAEVAIAIGSQNHVVRGLLNVRGSRDDRAPPDGCRW